MLIRLENPGMFARIIEIISELVTEAKIKVDEEGMKINAMDPANVAMVSFLMPKNSFIMYETDEEILGVNLDSLKKILKRCNPGSSLTMKKEENLLHIQIQDKIKRNFHLGLIEVETEEKEMPGLEFSSMVELNSKDFIDSVEDCSIVADACSFIIKDGKFILEAKGLNSARSEFSDEADIKAENCKSKYSLEYLQKFIKASKVFDKTTLRFANDHPLKMELKDPFLSLSFLLAPRVETDD